MKALDKVFDTQVITGRLLVINLLCQRKENFYMKKERKQ